LSICLLLQRYINRDEFGEVKADPLVKRVNGGSRREADAGGRSSLLEDGKRFRFYAGTGRRDLAAWNIAALPLSEKQQVQRIPLTEEAFNLMVSVESTRANLGVSETAIEARAIVERFAALKHTTDTVGVAPETTSESPKGNCFHVSGKRRYDRMLLTTNGGIAWLPPL